MAQRQDSYNNSHDLPPPPPAHHAHFQQAHGSDPRQQNQQYRQTQPEPPTPSQDNHSQRPTSIFHRQQSTSQATAGNQRPPSSRQSNNKSRSFSFHSDKHKRNGSKTDENYHETSAEKEARRLHSKADPTLAMSEAEPSMEAAMMHSSLAPLRAIQHKDAFGNMIADPDKSNPTRNRWERPLDTIRSFEAAIDGGYRRKSIGRSDSESTAHWNRRSSYHPSAQFGAGPQGRARPDSYFAGHASRPVSFRPESTQFSVGGPQTARSSIYGDARGYPDGGYGDYAPGPSRQRMPRAQTEPFGPGQGRDVYRLAHKDRSYETVTSAEGSGNSDQIGYQTDPTSSDNSSIERRSPAKRQEPVNDYGIGFGPSQSYGNFNTGANDSGAPPPPHASRQPAGRSEIVRKEAPSVLKRQPTQQAPQTQASPAPDKRKSWLARRFSKKD